jgi:hypothetical protein
MVAGEPATVKDRVLAEQVARCWEVAPVRGVEAPDVQARDEGGRLSAAATAACAVDRVPARFGHCFSVLGVSGV